MLTRILKFLKGYVVIRLSGYSPERFFNLCSRHRIVLWGLVNRGTEYEMCMSIGSFKKLRPLLHKTRTKAVILERHGLPFILRRYRRRKLFAVGAVCSMALLYVLSLFIWNIHVEGNLSLSDQVILEYLESEQVVHGMGKWQVHGEDIEAKLREHFPEITWTSAEVRGTRLIIHVKENEDASFGEAEETGAADLLAAADGLVSSIIVRSGTPAVSEGDEVKEGDVLVSSRVEVTDDAGEPVSVYYVHADADVLIRRTERYAQSFSMEYEKKTYTGRSRTAFYVMLGSRRFAFSLPGETFGTCDLLTSELPLRLTENFYLPAAVGKNTVREYEMIPAVYTEEEAREKAKAGLSLFFEKLSIKGLQIIENNVKIEISGGVCTASGTYVTESGAVKEQAPEIDLPAEEEAEEERDQRN
ncbi:MAG: sporulation protein YqfD [Eubacteriales bacterium]|nr:sporulation protein YqfD [Eubacteriales bacterium]